MKRSRRARHVRLTVKPGGGAVLTVPVRVSIEFVQSFLRSKMSWISKAVARMQKVLPVKRRPRGEYKTRRGEAERLVRERIAVLNLVYGFRFRSVTIRNQKGRWGSCSLRGNLRFNYRVVLLPPALADYVIVHELCHLQEMNHSKKFWALVAKVIPNPKQVRRRLRTYPLHAI